MACGCSGSTPKQQSAAAAQAAAAAANGQAETGPKAPGYYYTGPAKRAERQGSTSR